MKKINFIETLIKEDKIRLIEPSKVISSSYSKKSQNSFKAAKLLLDHELLEESTSMAYFAMYHKALSLLYLIGIRCENHSATIILLRELFGIENKEILFAKTQRIDKQYFIDFIITKQEVTLLIQQTESFIDVLDSFIDNLSEEMKRYYLDQFLRIYKK